MVFLTFISLFFLIVYLIPFNTNNKRHFLTHMLTRVLTTERFLILALSGPILSYLGRMIPPHIKIVITFGRLIVLT